MFFAWPNSFTGFHFRLIRFIRYMAKCSVSKCIIFAYIWSQPSIDFLNSIGLIIYIGKKLWSLNIFLKTYHLIEATLLFLDCCPRVNIIWHAVQRSLDFILYSPLLTSPMNVEHSHCRRCPSIAILRWYAANAIDKIAAVGVASGFSSELTEFTPIGRHIKF